MTTQPEAPARPIRVGSSIHLRRALTVLAAAATALAIWAVAAPGLGLDLAVRQGAGTTVVGAGSVLAASLVAGLAAWGLTAILERFTARARSVWLVTAMIALLLSLAGPLAGGVRLAATFALVLMHIGVGAVLLLGLAPQRPAGTSTGMPWSPTDAGSTPR